jgi:hypothetical protein
MKLLFCEGSSLSAREALTILGRDHKIIICDPNPFSICRFTKFRTKYYRCPSVNESVSGYLARIKEIIVKEKIDVLIPVHEQALLFARHYQELSPIVHLEIPCFDSYLKLFSKIKFITFLDELKIPHPKTIFCQNHKEIRKKIYYPCYLKTDYGTASSSVWRIENESDLDSVLLSDPKNGNLYLIQEPAAGKMEIAYAAFNRGKLISFHCCQRIKEGIQGSSSGKIGVDRPIVKTHFSMIGEKLDWHGPLAIDYFYDEANDVPYYFDASPRLVEPMNAFINGVNIPQDVIALSYQNGVESIIKPTKGIKSHMLMMSLLQTAKTKGRRGDVIKDIWAAICSTGDYKDSYEELTNWKYDYVSVLPLVYVIVQLLINPQRAIRISQSTVKNYALSYDAICKIMNN